MVALGLAAALSSPAPAEACILLPAEGGRMPAVSVERVLIVHDAAQGIEHFIREVRFDGASGTFAFVVPTPGKPEVAAVEPQPFDALTRDFPVEPPPQEPEYDVDAKSGPVAAAPPRGVQVLSTTQVGKFTAFVLAADDSGALSKWLTDNRITVPPGGDVWLKHYVKLGFFYTAFRYEAPAGGAGTAMTSESVRLTFKTPVPYFPYLEPPSASAPAKPAEGEAATEPQQILPHEMQVWLVSTSRREPRVRRMVAGQAPRWAWAWESGMTYDPSHDELAKSLGKHAALLPRGDLTVQTFKDTRTDRDGWSDVIFPEEDVDLESPAFSKTATSLLGSLDTLIHAGTAEPSETAREEVYRVPPSSGGCACDLGRAPSPHGRGAALLALGGVLVAVTRRRTRR